MKLETSSIQRTQAKRETIAIAIAIAITSPFRYVIKVITIPRAVRSIELQGIGSTSIMRGTCSRGTDAGCWDLSLWIDYYNRRVDG